jgi:hypothetical protein
MPHQELPIIQKAHELILWYVPILNRLPRDQKFMLGDHSVRAACLNCTKGAVARM